VFVAAIVPARRAPTQQMRCVPLEVYFRSSQPQSADVLKTLNKFAEDKPGIKVTVRDVEGSDAQTCRDRLRQIARHFQFDATKTPVVYGCNRVIVGPQDDSALTSALNDMLRMDVYVRPGCPRCDKAKLFLKELEASYSGLDVRVRDIISDTDARSDLDRLVHRHRQAATSVPVFDLCDQLIVGFDSETTTGKRIEQTLAPWTSECLIPPKSSNSRSRDTPSSKAGGWEPTSRGSSDMLHSGATLILFAWSADEDEASSDGFDEELLPLPIPGAGESLPLPTQRLPVPGDSVPPADTMEVPFFGRLSADRLGLPVFTIAVGLVDGFNPCAMWVLLFLLSILVNLKDRWRILAVAGVFVAISGLAYFAFMAAWLNIFLWVGLLRPVQVTLALTAIAVGAIHIKDFFAFKQGVTLSIPESAKPGIYARVRRIVTAESLLGAMIGASVLAVMVNVVELLCTAGLPALYTEILALQQLPTWQNYSYLALYNVAYMFDDGLMVALVVITLGRRKMQQEHGRVLKLVSGAAILLLGLVMLIKPEWLV
jgi:glutaredoxin